MTVETPKSPDCCSNARSTSTSDCSLSSKYSALGHTCSASIEVVQFRKGTCGQCTATGQDRKRGTFSHPQERKIAEYRIKIEWNARHWRYKPQGQHLYDVAFWPSWPGHSPTWLCRRTWKHGSTLRPSSWVAGIIRNISCDWNMFGPNKNRNSPQNHQLNTMVSPWFNPF